MLIVRATRLVCSTFKVANFRLRYGRFIAVHGLFVIKRDTLFLELEFVGFSYLLN